MLLSSPFCDQFAYIKVLVPGVTYTPIWVWDFNDTWTWLPPDMAGDIRWYGLGAKSTSINPLGWLLVQRDIPRISGSGSRLVSATWYSGGEQMISFWYYLDIAFLTILFFFHPKLTKSSKMNNEIMIVRGYYIQEYYIGEEEVVNTCDSCHGSSQNASTTQCQHDARMPLPAHRRMQLSCHTALLPVFQHWPLKPRLHVSSCACPFRWKFWV